MFGFDSGVAANRSLLRHTELGNIGEWATGGSGSLDINKGDGQKLTCMGQFYDALLVWKERSMYQVRGWDIYSFERTLVNPNVGCEANRSVVVTDSAVFWANRNGIYAWDGTRINYISDKIEPTWQALTPTSILNAVGANYKKENWYVLAVPGAGSVNTKWIVYDYVMGSFTIFDIAAKEFWLADEVLYFSDYHGKVHQFEDGSFNDAGAPIDAYWYSNWFDMGHFGKAKQFRQLWTSAKGLAGSLSATYQINLDASDLETKTFSTTGNGWIWGTSVWGVNVWGTSGYMNDRFDFKSPVAFRLRIKYGNSTQNEGFEVLDYMLRYKWLGYR